MGCIPSKPPNPPVCRKEPEGDSLGLLTFTFRELKEATRNFGASNLVGEGGFGEVFRGRVILSAAYVSSRASVDDSHRGEPDAPHLDKTQSSREVQVAVKRLREANDDGVEQFLKEMAVLGLLKHPNLVTLYGACREHGAYLVYELMEGGSLTSALEQSWRGKLHLPWESRTRIMWDVTCGLEYLHSCQVIHRDVKSGNILLAKDFSAKLTDFGMVRTGPDKTLVSVVSTRIMGSNVYIDPSYMETGHLGYASDVYSLGVVLLELMTGSTVDDADSGFVGSLQETLVSDQPLSLDIVDARLEGKYNTEQALLVAKVAKACLSYSRKDRPKMKEVKETFDAVFGSQFS